MPHPCSRHRAIIALRQFDLEAIVAMALRASRTAALWRYATSGDNGWPVSACSVAVSATVYARRRSAMRGPHLCRPSAMRRPPIPARTHNSRGHVPSNSASAARRAGGRSTAVISSPGCRVVSIRMIAGQSMKPAMQSTVPWDHSRTTASSRRAPRSYRMDSSRCTALAPG